MSPVFMDTAPLIYLFEGQWAVRKIVRDRIAAWLDADVPLYSSVLTLAELLVPAQRAKKTGVIYRYKSALRELLSAPLHSIDDAQAECASALRAKYGFATPDALQLSCAMSLDCEIFYTNDRHLRKCKDIEVVCVAETSLAS